MLTLLKATRPDGGIPAWPFRFLQSLPQVTMTTSGMSSMRQVIDNVGLVLQNDAQGIGLFRGEFIYLDSEDYPSEEQQFLIYKRVIETMAGKKVIIRTLDIGADKQASYFQLDKEENPALGYRAIRICLP